MAAPIPPPPPPLGEGQGMGPGARVLHLEVPADSRRLDEGPGNLAVMLPIP